MLYAEFTGAGCGVQYLQVQYAVQYTSTVYSMQNIKVQYAVYRSEERRGGKEG